MLAEALHSVADILNQFLLRIGVLKVGGRSGRRIGSGEHALDEWILHES